MATGATRPHRHPPDPIAGLRRCNYCQALTVEMGGMARCPRGCPGYMTVLGDVRVPREGVKKALKDARP